MRNRYSAAARGGHSRLLDPGTDGGVQLVHLVDIALLISRELAADQVDLPVDGNRHPVVVRLRQWRSNLPAVGRDVVDLHRADRLTAGRITAEDVELAVQFGERKLGV